MYLSSWRGAGTLKGSRKMGFLVFPRSYGSSVKNSARMIRNEFLDYFRNDLGHSFVRSSPVTPLHDPTVPFVNAGMNQFKGIFLNYYESPVAKAVNSQKCIRVDGKHNDLKVVGTDGYHHTFFEMLGNWSFGSYFKEDACRYAWKLLTERYGIKKEFLYVTYFGGDEKLGLGPDLECQDIWLRVGVPKDRILAFGLKENFWEMANIGPCGACTEIHVDHTKQSSNQSAKVNMGFPDLTELWNIVFIEYERVNDQSIVPLKKQYIDTGMGFERLVALLQEKKSNYDTDLFRPLFETIEKHTKAPEYKGKFGIHDENGIDTAYRILADHSRTVAVSLADGMLPEKCKKLRKIIRKTIDTEEKIFKTSGVLSELSSAVSDTLGDFYPELHKNLKQVQQIIRFEEELYEELKRTSGQDWLKMVQARPELVAITEWTAPGLLNAYKDLQSMVKDFKKDGTLPGHYAFKLYDTYGLDVDTVAELAEIESLNFAETSFQAELNNAKYKSKIGAHDHLLATQKLITVLRENNVPKTDDSLKYEYSFKEKFVFPKAKSKMLGILANGQVFLNNEEGLTLSKDILNAETCGIILDRTVCYASQGGQKSDKGVIQIKGHVFRVNNVEKIHDYVIHFGSFLKKNSENVEETAIGEDDCEVSIMPDIRTGAMMHHTATHLLNAALGKSLQTVRQCESTVLHHNLKFQYTSFGEQLSFDQLRKVEELINNVIGANVPVTTKSVNSFELLNEENLTLVPDEVYPYTGIRIVEVNSHNLKSKEACCGTHVFNTGDLMHFCLLNYSATTLHHTIEAAVGPPALKVKQICENVYNRIAALEEKIKCEKHPYKTARSMINQQKQEIKKGTKNEKLPFLVKDDCLTRLEKFDKAIWDQEKEVERSEIHDEIKNIADPSLPCIVYCLSKNPVYLSLHEVVSLNPTTPNLIFVQNRGAVKARCYIPENMTSETFNATNWMAIVLRIFDGKSGPTTGFNPLSVANMRFQAVPDDQLEPLIRRAIAECVRFAREQIRESKVSGQVA